MTTQQAINRAMAIAAKECKGDIRTIELMEGTGSGSRWKQLTIRIGYSIDGDYTESDKEPFEVNVIDQDGKIVAERLIGEEEN